MDLYDIYEKLFPDMPEDEFYKLPSPRDILYAYDSDNPPFPVVDYWGESKRNVVIKVQDTLVHLSAGYNGEWGLDDNYNVEIVEAVRVQRTVIEYRSK